jgi:alkylation response protein AidB-like acyl-CoA dehydrogenase
MTSTADVGDKVVALARGMRDLVRAEAAESERIRTLTGAIVDEMWASGLMSAFNPVAAGGVEPSFAEMIETWIEMAWQDGSFGWIGIANLPSSFAAAAYLPDEGFTEVFTAHDNQVTMGGQFFPNGQGTVVDALTPALRADMRAAAVYATDVARSCAEWAHLAAGTSSIREGTRLERAFRDMYTGTQHAFISEKVAIDSAQIWLGIIDDQFGL